jgi:hypothetical protein
MMDDHSTPNIRYSGAADAHGQKRGIAQPLNSHPHPSHGTFLWRFPARPFLVLALFSTAVFTGCYERKQNAVINPDGSGKVFIETVVVVPSRGLPGREKPNALSYGRLVAADLINLTRGVEAWADLSISEVENPPGHAGTAPAGGVLRARIAATAYFKDLNDLRFDKLPLDFTWKRDETGAAFAIQRTRTAVRGAATLSEAAINQLVARSRDDYRSQRQALQTQLVAYTLDMRFELPGEVAEAQVFRRAGNAVSLSIDGQKAMQALDKFMADDAALQATFKAGLDLPSNDDLLLDSMYGSKGPVRAVVKIAPDAKPAFDYRTEMRAAQLRQGAMINDAGVQLPATFTVPPPSSRPASQPATRGQ